MARSIVQRQTCLGTPNASGGILAAVGFVSIWAAWIVGTRHAVTHEIDPYAVGFLRFAVPTLVFARVWWRTGLKPAGVGWMTLVGLMGAGAPFFLCVGTAMKFVPAAEVGPLLTGSMPVIVALLMMLVGGERLSRTRTLGLLLVVAGVVAIAREAASGDCGAWLGQALLVCGAFMWAVYTLAYKRSGLGAFEAAALVAIWSTLLLAPLGIPGIVSAIHAGLGASILAQALIQGVLSGVVAIVLYGIAISHLGASRGAAFVALVPGLAALIGIPLLHETPTVTTIIAIVGTAAGVVLLSGAVTIDRLRALTRRSCPS